MLRKPGFTGRYNQYGYGPSLWYKNSEWRAEAADGTFVTPVMVADFANNVYAVDTGSGLQEIPFSSLFTFTRASDATRVSRLKRIETVGNNVQRYMYNPSSGTSLGLILESLRTNLMLRSDDISNATWQKSACSVSGAGAIKAPDGTTDVYPITIDSTTATHIVAQTVTITAGSSLAATVYVRAGTWGRVRVAIDNSSFSSSAFAYVDLSTGTIINANKTGTGVLSFAAIEDYGNGWYRVIVVGTLAPAATNARFSVTFSEVSGNISYLGNGTDSFYMWGMDVQVGTYPTTYIPTTNAQVTRAIDFLKFKVSAFPYVQSEGSWIAHATFNAVTGNSQRIIDCYTDGNNRYMLGIAPNGQFIISGVTGGTNDASIQGAMGPVTAVAGSVFKVAAGYKLNSWKGCVNGGTVATDSTGSVPTITDINIGSSYANNLPMVGTQSRILYYPKLLKDSEYQRLTA